MEKGVLVMAVKEGKAVFVFRYWRNRTREGWAYIEYRQSGSLTGYEQKSGKSHSFQLRYGFVVLFILRLKRGVSSSLLLFVILNLKFVAGGWFLT
jgi:hypothetical protein